MKSVIDGKLYNTDTATKIGDYDTGGSVNDFNYYRESLYVTKKGSYFLAGEGHGNTKYAYHSSGGTRSWGSDIYPLTIDEALEWASRNLDTETVQEHFHDMVVEA